MTSAQSTDKELTQKYKGVLAQIFSEESEREVAYRVSFAINADGSQHIGESYSASKRAQQSEKSLALLSQLSAGYQLLTSAREDRASYIVGAGTLIGSRSKVDFIDLCTSKLSRMADGWAGAGSYSPKLAALRDLLGIRPIMRMVQSNPSVEVDPSGIFSLVWERDHHCFALTFLGDGTVIGTLSPRALDYKPWKCLASDEVTLLERFEHPKVRQLVERR